MMAKFPRLTGQKVIAALKKGGFEVLRIKGSHHFLTHPMAGARLCRFIGVKSLARADAENLA